MRALPGSQRCPACTCTPAARAPSRSTVPLGGVPALRLARTQQRQQRRGGRAAAQDGQQAAQGSEQPQQQPPSYGEGLFLLKLLGLSFTGAAVVKYGELLLGDVPFSHDLGLALTMVFGPCIVYSVVLASRPESW